ncbi:MAG TPA: 1,4-dihydroxy-2-naphthoate polyprenyltransferase [Rubrobacteraceae bacterium]|nr:1,4-dihydroxy-2-naphthoate polyprenyltransferase [Rubrobacteraceae bacterium]
MGSSREILAEWFWLARPFSLTAAAIPVLFGTALAFTDGAFAWGPFLAMLFASLLIQAATNMFNEFYDEQRGLDTESSVGIAGSIVRGRLKAREVLLGALFCYTLALFLGLYLVYVGGWPILLLGCLSALGGYVYSAGPRPVAYTPAGEATVFVFMGLVIVVITYGVQAGSYPLSVPLAATPIGALVAAILLANNIRDLESDRRGGRNTLPVALGRQGGVTVYRALLLGSYLLVGALALVGTVPFGALLAFSSAPLAARLWRRVSSSTIPERLDPVVKGTAGLHASFGLLYTIGLLLPF